MLWSELGNMQQAARARHNLGNIALAAGELEKAAANYEESLRSSRTLRDSYLNSLVLCGLGIVALKQVDLKRARALFRESLAICAERGDRRVGSEALTGLAAVAVADGDLVRGIRLAGAVHAICQEMGVPIAPDDLEILEENVFPLREQIGSAPFDTELAAGKAMSFDNAIAYAIAADLARSAAGRAK